MNMCAATGATPTAVSAGTTITAEMMYDAVTGTASPRIHTAIAENSTVRRQRPARQADDQSGGLQSPGQSS